MDQTPPVPDDEDSGALFGDDQNNGPGEPQREDSDSNRTRLGPPGFAGARPRKQPEGEQAARPRAVRRSGDTDDARSQPDRIGRYRILHLIGRGGMGVVYEAEQDQPRRIVALKVVNPGLASPRHLKRFEHEAELLGRLQHPGIAQIFEAGTLDAGAGPQPFFAMELIHGEPLTTYAERRQTLHAKASRTHRAHLRRGAARPPARHHPPRPQTLEHPR